MSIMLKPTIESVAGSYYKPQATWKSLTPAQKLAAILITLAAGFGGGFYTGTGLAAAGKGPLETSVEKRERERQTAREKGML